MKGTLQFMGMVAVLIIGVLLGLQAADRGLGKVGNPEKAKPSTVYVTKVENGKAVLSAVRDTPSTTQLKVNHLSQIGRAIGDWVKEQTRRSIAWLASWFSP